jgi:HEPN domain-containing protein
MCHQANEKALKAVISRDCEEWEFPPKIHNLIKLADRAGLYDKMTEQQKDFITDFNPLNIEARYPEHRKRIAAGLTNEYCKELIGKSEEMLCWIKTQL